MRNPLGNPVRRAVDRSGAPPQQIWKTVASVAGIVSAVAATRALEIVRRRRSRRGDVPLNPVDERMTWPYALAWTGVVAVAAASARMLAQIGVAQAWKRTRQQPVAAMSD